MSGNYTSTGNLRHQLHRVLKCLIEALQSEYVSATFDTKMKTTCSAIARCYSSRDVWCLMAGSGAQALSEFLFQTTTPWRDNPYFVAVANYNASGKLCI